MARKARKNGEELHFFRQKRRTVRRLTIMYTSTLDIVLIVVEDF